MTAIDGTSITVETADGQRTQVATSDTTTWVEQTVVTRDVVIVGSEVRFTPEGGFGGRGQGGFGQGGQVGQGGQQGPDAQGDQGGLGGPAASSAPGATAITVSDVEVLLPTS